jgi:uncharacterized protein with FMN-binding domain
LLTESGDGNYSPNNPITYTEFVTLTSNILKAKEQNLEVQLESTTDYITRQDAIKSICIIAGLNVHKADTSILRQVKDSNAILNSMSNYIAAAISNGYIAGANGRINPNGMLTRAEAITLLNHIYKNERVLAFPGNYELGEIDSVFVLCGGITLGDTIIEKNLTISGQVGDGSVTLQKVTVKGTLSQISNKTKLVMDSSTTVSKIQKTNADVMTYKDGTYEGIARGFNAGLHVFTTIKGGKISKVELGKNEEDEPFITQAASRVIPAIVAQNSPNVDVATGATYSSAGIMDAVKYALKLAAADGNVESTEKEQNYLLLAKNNIENGDTKYYDVKELSDGGYIASGLAKADGKSNALIVKYSPSGTVVWKKSFEGAAYSNIIPVLGHGYLFAGNATQNDDTDAKVLMLDEDGKTLWEKVLGGKDYDVFGAHSYTRTKYALQLADKNILIGGTTKSSDGIFKENAGDYDGFLAILNHETGDIISTKLIGGKKHDAVSSVSQTSDGDIIICGVTESTDGLLKDGVPSENGNVFVSKWSSDLKTIRWTKMIATKGDSWGAGAEIDSKDNVFVAYGQRAEGKDTEEQSYVYVTMLDSEGKELWTKDYKNGDSNYVVSTAMSKMDEFIITIESYFTKSNDTNEMYGWIGMINSKGELSWSTPYETYSQNLLFNVHPSTDASYLLVSGEAQNDKGFYDATIVKYAIPVNGMLKGR